MKFEARAKAEKQSEMFSSSFTVAVKQSNLKHAVSFYGSIFTQLQSKTVEGLFIALSVQII